MNHPKGLVGCPEGATQMKNKEKDQNEAVDLEVTDNEVTPDEDRQEEAAEGTEMEPEKAADDRGFPENTPLAEMSLEQREAYWKHQSRRQERELKALRKAASDAEEAKRLEALTESERLVEAARAEARAEALKEVGVKNVDALVSAYVSVGKVTREQANTILAGLDRSAFLTADGDVDTDRLGEYFSIIAPAPKDVRRGDPHQGAFGSAGRPSSVESGRRLHDQRHGK